MRARLDRDIGSATGSDAIRAMALVLRAFAHERLGLSAATFRNPTTDSPEWRREGELLGAVAVRVFESAGLDREQAINALQILRALVRGFVLHEMTASFLDTVDYDQIYAVAVDVFIRGLDVYAMLDTGRNHDPIPYVFNLGNGEMKLGDKIGHMAVCDAWRLGIKSPAADGEVRWLIKMGSD